MTRLQRYMTLTTPADRREDMALIDAARRQRRLARLAKRSWKICGVGRFASSHEAGAALGLARQTVHGAESDGTRARGHRVRWAGRRFREIDNLSRCRVRPKTTWKGGEKMVQIPTSPPKHQDLRKNKGGWLWIVCQHGEVVATGNSTQVAKVIGVNPSVLLKWRRGDQKSKAGYTVEVQERDQAQKEAA